MSVIIDSISCAGQTGTITLNVNDTSGISYLWNTGDVTAQLTGIQGGNYTATITNILGCPTFVNIEVQDPPILTTSPTASIAVAKAFAASNPELLADD